MTFVPVSEYITLELDPDKEIMQPEQINKELGNKNCFGYDIYLDQERIGFTLVAKYSRRGFFIWQYAIDKKYQDKGYGTQALSELLQVLKKEYKAKTVTVTYTWGNRKARHVYDKVGFIQTEVAGGPDGREVNMEIWL